MAESVIFVFIVDVESLRQAYDYWQDQPGLGWRRRLSPSRAPRSRGRRSPRRDPSTQHIICLFLLVIGYCLCMFGCVCVVVSYVVCLLLAIVFVYPSTYSTNASYIDVAAMLRRYRVMAQACYALRNCYWYHYHR